MLRLLQRDNADPCCGVSIKWDLLEDVAWRCRHVPAPEPPLHQSPGLLHQIGQLCVAWPPARQGNLSRSALCTISVITELTMTSQPLRRCTCMARCKAQQRSIGTEPETARQGNILPCAWVQSMYVTGKEAG